MLLVERSEMSHRKLTNKTSGAFIFPVIFLVSISLLNKIEGSQNAITHLQLGVVHRGLAMSAGVQLCLVDATVKCQTLIPWGVTSKLLVLSKRQKNFFPHFHFAQSLLYYYSIITDIITIFLLYYY